MFSSQGTLQAEEPDLDPGTAPWGVYSSGQSVDSLIAYLNPQGQRESVLKRVCLSPPLCFLPEEGCSVRYYGRAGSYELGAHNASGLVLQG